MPIPGDNYVLRLHEIDGTLIDMNVLDLAHTDAGERAALIRWSYGTRASATVAGFSILRFDPLGNVTAQFSKTLCSFNNFECGNFALDTATLLSTVDGFLIAGTAKDLFRDVQHPIAIRMDTVGNVRWARKYAADVGHPTTARITSIVPLETPSRYLISAVSTEDESWLFQIDGGSGNLVSSRLIWYMRIRRLRMTSLGILAVGEMSTLESPEPALMAFDPVAATPLWIRTWTWENEGADTGVRWFDVAEGKDVLLVVGNAVGHVHEISPWMAFLQKGSLPTPGDLIKVLIPAHGDDAVRLRAVVNHQDLLIPLADGAVNSIFCVTGNANDRPWSFAIAEDGTLLWQKALRLPDAATGSQTPILWPSYEEIITGGFVTTGSTPRGFIFSSPVTNGRGTSNCSQETSVTFPEGVLYEHRPLPEDEPLLMHALDWATDQGRDVAVRKGCLDSQ